MRKTPLILGLTGGIATGKTTVAKMFLASAATSVVLLKLRKSCYQNYSDVIHLLDTESFDVENVEMNGNTTLTDCL